VKCLHPPLVIFALCVSLAQAEDFKTVNGKEYKNVTVSRVEPDGIVLKGKSGISKIYFVEFPKDVQERFHYNAANVTAASGIEGLTPITVGLRDEILNALKMTNSMDALYERGCKSDEFIAAAVPVERVFINLGNKLPKPDPRRDLFANTLDGYQQLAIAMKAYELGRGQRPDAMFAAAGLRKHLLTRILEGNMTPEEKTVYYTWRKATETNP
jgi:hypothetical protein